MILLNYLNSQNSIPDNTNKIGSHSRTYFLVKTLPKTIYSIPNNNKRGLT